jgi:hypothetical protein
MQIFRWGEIRFSSLRKNGGAAWRQAKEGCGCLWKRESLITLGCDTGECFFADLMQ